MLIRPGRMKIAMAEGYFRRALQGFSGSSGKEGPVTAAGHVNGPAPGADGEAPSPHVSRP